MTLKNDGKKINRLQKIYHRRKILKKDQLYEWYNLDVHKNIFYHNTILAKYFKKIFGNDLSKIKVLDIGCGDGSFIRKLIEWGFKPQNIVGIDILDYRIKQCKEKTNKNVNFYLSSLNSKFKNYDLVVANTVFTSILEDGSRKKFASNIYNAVKKNGWILIFDFRYNNPFNSNVRKITPKNLKSFWPQLKICYHSYLILIPFISRKISCLPHIIYDFLIFLFPFLKSHFIFFGKK